MSRQRICCPSQHEKCHKREILRSGRKDCDQWRVTNWKLNLPLTKVAADFTPDTIFGVQLPNGISVNNSWPKIRSRRNVESQRQLEAQILCSWSFHSHEWK